MVECVTHQSFEEYLQENVFNPLNMTNSGINASEFVENHATPYTRKSGSNSELELYSTWIIRSSVTDLAHFLIAHLNNGKYEDQQLLQQRTLDMMHAKVVQYSQYRNPIVQDVNNYRFTQHSYGLGWSHFKDGFGGHGGSTPGFISVMAGRKHSDGSSTGILLFMNVNALFGDSEDLNEIQTCYNTLINTILFELNLIPSINQEFIDIYIFVDTLWITGVLILYFGVQLTDKEKLIIHSNSLAKNQIKFVFLINGLIAFISGVNYFSVNDWVRLFLFVPIVSYFGFLFVFTFKQKEKFSLFVIQPPRGYVIQGWVILSLLGLALYNFSYSKLNPLIPITLCVLAIAFVAIYTLKIIKIQLDASD